MKKVYKLEELDCAGCAAKMETAIKQLNGVTDASVSFIASKLTLVTECDDQSEILREVKRVIKKIEPDCTVVV